MTPEQIALVQNSFAKIGPMADVTADLFYDHLFEIAPEVRVLFPEDLADQKRKLVGILATAITNLHQLDKILPAVEDLGKRHKQYRVKPEHYQPAGAALLWTLEQVLGTDFTPALNKAWSDAYFALSAVMQKAAATA